MKKAALITVHGMGDTPPNYADQIKAEISQRLGPKSDALHVGSVYYQDILQANQERVWTALNGRLRWGFLRKFLLYGFADAAGLESGKEGLKSVYSIAQQKIAKELYLAKQAVGESGPVIFLAHSLGCQVVSCYFWDALKARAGRPVSIGIWQDINAFQQVITGGPSLSPADHSFLQGSTFHQFITTGCNIPVFVAAHATADIIPIRPSGNFEWLNFYDPDDVLGWPLAGLSDHYAAVVKDCPVNADSGALGWVLKSWNPASHLEYWGDHDLLGQLEKVLLKYLA